MTWARNGSGKSEGDDGEDYRAANRGTTEGGVAYAEGMAEVWEHVQRKTKAEITRIAGDFGIR